MYGYFLDFEFKSEQILIPILANNILQGLSLISSLDWAKEKLTENKLKDMIMTQTEVYQIAYGVAQDIAYKYGANTIDFTNVAVAVAKTESNFNPKAKNKKSSARGLMQLIICTQRWMEKVNGLDFAPASKSCSKYPTTISNNDKMFEPEYAMLIGMHYLGYQYKRYKNWDKAVFAYNQGSIKGNQKDGNKYLATVNKNMNRLIAYAGSGEKRIEYY